MRRSLPLSWFTVAVLALGAALRLWVIHAHPQIQGDSLIYGDIATNWLHHGIYGHTVGHAPGPDTVDPTLVRLPGYPAFLAACFALFGTPNYRAVLYLQALIDLVSCLLIAGFACRVGGQRVGRIALVLAAVCPFTAFYAAAPLTETLSIFCVALGFYALAKETDTPTFSSLALITSAWTFATLLRPDGALLAVVLWASMLFYGRRAQPFSRVFTRALLAGIVSLLPFAAWAARNERTFHVFQPLAPRYANDPDEYPFPGFVQWIKTFTADFTATNEIYWNGNSDRIDYNTLPSRAIDSPAEAEQTRALLNDYNATTTITPEMDTRFTQLAKQRIRANPVRYYVILPALRLADMWFRPRVETFNGQLRWWQYAKHPAETRVAIYLGLLNLAYLLAAIAGCFYRPAWLGAMLAFVAVRSALLATLEAPEPRYTLECFPVVFVLAAAALAALRKYEATSRPV